MMNILANFKFVWLLQKYLVERKSVSEGGGLRFIFCLGLVWFSNSIYLNTITIPDANEKIAIKHLAIPENRYT